MRVAWTAPAARDLHAIGEYIGMENPAAAGRILRRIVSRTRDLARHPGLGRPGRIDGTRELVITGTPFLIAYRATPHEVHILAVLHGARRWPPGP